MGSLWTQGLHCSTLPQTCHGERTHVLQAEGWNGLNDKEDLELMHRKGGGNSTNIRQPSVPGKRQPLCEYSQTMWQGRQGWKSNLRAERRPLVSIGLRCGASMRGGGDAEQGSQKPQKAQSQPHVQGLEPFTQGWWGFTTSWGYNQLATLKSFPQTDEIMSSLRTFKVSYFYFWILNCWMAYCLKHRNTVLGN